jgi:tight adherence protein B
MPALFGESGILLFLAPGFAFGSVALLVLALLVPWNTLSTGERLRQFTERRPDAGVTPDASQILRTRVYSSNRVVDRMLRGYGLSESIARDLARARVSLRVGEFLAISLFLAGGGFFVGLTLTGSPIGGLVAGALGYLAPRVYISRRQGQRLEAVDGQLVDMLALASNSLRSGWGFLQALEQVSTELPPPLAEEARQVLEEVSLGASPDDALLALQQRIPSYDLELIITAVVIQRKVGGNLAEMLDSIAYTIRERVKLLGEIRGITAESRLSMWVLAVLPIALLAIMSVTSPGYVAPLFADPRGRMILMGAAAMEVAGVFVLRKLSKIEV